MDSETAPWTLSEAGTKKVAGSSNQRPSDFYGVNMAKEFKTLDELIALLESRGVETDGETKRQLIRESYYAIVNGYKGPFLDRENMAGTNEDLFLPGTRFEWIYSLFMFDRDLRGIAFKFITRAEAIMKNSLVYAFCEAYPDPNAYLDISSYVDADNFLVPESGKLKKRRLHQRNLATLLRILNGKVGGKSEKGFIKHYIDHYGFVPLWVLSNDLTFGNMAHFYQLQRRGIQNKTCKLVLEGSDKQNEGGRITPLQLLHSFSVLVDFRNLCAHDDRLYCAKTGRSHDIAFANMAVELKRILPEDEMENFLNEINGLFESYGSKLHGVDRIRLINEMGFWIPSDEEQSE